VAKHRPEKPKAGRPGKGELRRRVRAFITDGTLTKLGSEGRLLALYVFDRADWTTCEVRFSRRHVARVLGVSPTAIRRGVEQLSEQGILAISERSAGSGKTKFVVADRTHSVSTPDTPRVHPRTHSVSTPDTPRVRSAHTVCPERARSVSGARTPCDHYSVLFSGIHSVNTSEGSSTAEASARAGTAEPQPLIEDESVSPAAASLALSDTLTDEDKA